MVDVFVFSNKPTELEPSVRITGVVDIPFNLHIDVSSKSSSSMFLVFFDIFCVQRLVKESSQPVHDVLCRSRSL
jgi:hypothetical protein